MGHPTIYPTGVTVYDKDGAWNGYTVLPSAKGVILIDMNGREVRVWKGLKGDPPKILPGGHVMGSTGERALAGHTFDNLDLVQADWNGNIVWKFDRFEAISGDGAVPRWVARQNHDYQREGSATGYYSPGTSPRVDGGNTLMIVNRDVVNPLVSSKTLLDNTIIEVSWKGEIVWRWNANEHFDEMGFDEAAKNVLYRLPSSDAAHGGQGLWLAIGSIAKLGPNRWYDTGDERFHPENILWSARNANIVAIISKKDKNLVWRIGPDFVKIENKLGWIIGPHHAHIIERGLPGEGNLLVFDNGGAAGYGAPSEISKYGTANQKRDYSRVLEIDPTTLEIIWQYTPVEAQYLHPHDSYKFYSPFSGSAQRLPNGNTLITEGSDGRLFEVTREHKTVWEYVSPFFKNKRSNGLYYGGNSVYRAYRTPYEWIPDLEIPAEKSVKAKNISRFRVPGAPLGSGGKITLVEGVEPSDSKVLDDPLRGVVFPRALESSVSSDIDTHGQEQGCFKHGTA